MTDPHPFAPLAAAINHARRSEAIPLAELIIVMRPDRHRAFSKLIARATMPKRAYRRWRGRFKAQRKASR